MVTIGIFAAYTYLHELQYACTPSFGDDFREAKNYPGNYLLKDDLHNIANSLSSVRNVLV